MARAMATRCCWPPESSRRRVVFAARQANQMQRRHGALTALGLCGAAIDQRQFDIFDRRGAVKRL